MRELLGRRPLDDPQTREVAKQGARHSLASWRPGVRPDGVDPELVAARREIAWLSEAVKEMPIKLMLLEGKSAGDDGTGAPTGRRTGQGPPSRAGRRCGRAGLAGGVRAGAVLELEERRMRRSRSLLGYPDDGRPGRAVHGLLPFEVEGIVACSSASATSTAPAASWPTVLL